MKTYTGQITILQPNQVFVFGSNTQGRHGKGAAKQAMKFGAVYGQPYGRQGQTYAIVTKDLTKASHPSVAVDSIMGQIATLYNEATADPDTEYLIAYKGEGVNLNGYTPKQMAAMFRLAVVYSSQDSIPENITFERSFRNLVLEYRVIN